MFQISHVPGSAGPCGGVCFHCSLGSRHTTHTLCPAHAAVPHMPAEPPEAFRSAFKIIMQYNLTGLPHIQLVPLWTRKGLITDNRDFWYFPITAPQQESKQYILGLYYVRHASPTTSMCNFALFFNMVKLYIYSRIASKLIFCGSSPVSF